MLEKPNYTFPVEDGGLVSCTPVYTFDQFIITCRNDSLVQGFLTVFIKHLDHHDFGQVGSNRLSQKDLSGMPDDTFDYHDPECKRNIIKALTENNINILEHDIRYHMSFHLPITLYYKSVGELEGLLTSGEHDEVSWSLHFIDSSERI